MRICRTDTAWDEFFYSLGVAVGHVTADAPPLREVKIPAEFHLYLEEARGLIHTIQHAHDLIRPNLPLTSARVLNRMEDGLATLYRHTFLLSGDQCAK